jgi:hypothetical protein
VTAPLGPTHHDCLCSVWQAGVRCGARRRRCLLKGCPRVFSPLHPFSRYCSEACREAARIWSRRRSAADYRKTEAGREKRRQQSRRYRKRLRQRSIPRLAEATPLEPSPPGGPLAAPPQAAFATSTRTEPTQPGMPQLQPTPFEPTSSEPTSSEPTSSEPAPSEPMPVERTPIHLTTREPSPLELTARQVCCELCEGHHPPGAEKKFSCQRPGCYEQFVVSTRSPGQKFCSPLCRQALRCVLRREALWWKRLRALFRPGPPGRVGCGSRVGCVGES